MLSCSLKISEKKILVIGDLMLDEYWEGNVNRISPEAPVPIFLIDNETYKVGGAANVALNLAELGSYINLLGIIGDDPKGIILQNLVRQNPRVNANLIIAPQHPTINKLRIFAQKQQLFRLDKEQKFTAEQSQQINQKFKDITMLEQHDIIILSDYNKGSLANPQLFIDYANKFNIPIIIDPKNPQVELYRNASILTPNLKEFIQMIGDPTLDYLSPQDLGEKGHQLLKYLNLNALIITQGKDGLTVLTKDYNDCHFPTSARIVLDVTGAGDTVVAALAIGLANNYTLHQAAHLATIAAGIVVSKIGSSWVSYAEIKQELEYIESMDESNLSLGIIDEEKLISIIGQRKSRGETIVLVNGCFDVFHAGHLKYLEKAKSYGDRLIVAINDDDSIKRLKGQNLPINNLTERMTVIAGLKCVDWVVPFGSTEEIRPGRIISALNPDILVKSKENFKTIEEIPEHEGGPHVLKQGGKIYLLDRPISNLKISSSQIIAKIKNYNSTESINYEKI